MRAETQRLLSVDEVASRTGETAREVADKLRTFEYPGRLVGDRWQVPADFLQAFRARHLAKAHENRPNHRLFLNAESIFGRLPGLGACRTLSSAPLPGAGGAEIDFLLVADDRVSLVVCAQAGREQEGRRALDEALGHWGRWRERDPSLGRRFLDDMIRPCFDDTQLRGWCNLQKYPGGLGEWLQHLGWRWEDMDRVVQQLDLAARKLVPVLLVYEWPQRIDRHRLAEAVGEGFEGVAGYAHLPDGGAVTLL